MSDPKYGEPVEEPTAPDDVVGRAEEGLADAEAARRDTVAPDTVVVPAGERPAAVSAVDPTSAGSAAYASDEAPSAANGWAAETPAWATSAAALTPETTDEGPTTVHAAPASSEAATTAYDRAEVAGDRAVTPSEPAVAAGAGAAGVGAFGGGQPIFVQAPEAPRPRGNRGAAGAIGLLAALCFAVLYLAAWLGFGAIEGSVTAGNVGATALSALGTWSLWVPVVVFFLAFWLLGAIINRGRWGAWVVFGLLVGFASYGGHILGQLFQAPFWTLTASQGATLVEQQLLAPLAIVAFVVGRELTIWFGAWVAARGRRVSELNVEAQREYERTLEAGPQLYQG